MRSVKSSCSPLRLLTTNNHVSLKGFVISLLYICKVYCWMCNIILTCFPKHNFTVKGGHWKSQSDTVNSHLLTNQGKISSILESLKFNKIALFGPRVIETEKPYWMCHACPCRMLAFQFIAVYTDVIISKPLDHHCCSLLCAATEADQVAFTYEFKMNVICL